MIWTTMTTTTMRSVRMMCLLSCHLKAILYIIFCRGRGTYLPHFYYNIIRSPLYSTNLKQQSIPRAWKNIKKVSPLYNSRRILWVNWFWNRRTNAKDGAQNVSISHACIYKRFINVEYYLNKNSWLEKISHIFCTVRVCATEMIKLGTRPNGQFNFIILKIYITTSIRQLPF